MSKRTIKGDEERLRAYVSALVRTGYEPGRLTDLRDLVKPDVIKDGLRFFLARKDGKTSSYTSGIAATLFAVGRYLAAQTPPLIDDQQLAAVKALYKKVRYKQGGVTEKNKALLRLFVDPRNVAKLLFLPARLIQGIQLHGKPTVRDALRVQNALAIEILLVFPIRESNLVALHLQKNIIRTGQHKGADVLIVIPAADVKNNRDLEVVLPRSAVELLDLYCDRYLPLLAPAGEDWLFPGQVRGHKHPQGFGPQLKRVIYRETGLPINIHFFRHFSAKLWLDRNPGQFTVMKLALGHGSERTLRDFYAEFSSTQALALYDQHVLKLREELAHLAKPARGRSRK
jgi:integrase